RVARPCPVARPAWVAGRPAVLERGRSSRADAGCGSAAGLCVFHQLRGAAGRQRLARARARPQPRQPAPAARRARRGPPPPRPPRPSAPPPEPEPTPIGAGSPPDRRGAAPKAPYYQFNVPLGRRPGDPPPAVARQAPPTPQGSVQFSMTLTVDDGNGRRYWLG